MAAQPTVRNFTLFWWDHEILYILCFSWNPFYYWNICLSVNCLHTYIRTWLGHLSTFWNWTPTLIRSLNICFLETLMGLDWNPLGADLQGCGHGCISIFSTTTAILYPARGHSSLPDLPPVGQSVILRPPRLLGLSIWIPKYHTGVVGLVAGLYLSFLLKMSSSQDFQGHPRKLSLSYLILYYSFVSLP